MAHMPEQQPSPWSAGRRLGAGCGDIPRQRRRVARGPIPLATSPAPRPNGPDVTDLEKIADDLATEAVVAAGKDRARRALEDLTLSDEEKALRDEREARARRLLKWKVLAGAVLGVALVLWLISHLWTWLLGLAVLLGLGVPAYFFARRKLRALGQRRLARASTNLPVEPRRIAEPASANAAALEAQEREIDDELAAMKEKARR